MTIFSNTKQRRVVDILRKHETLGGDWQYDRDAHEWVRSDGVRVYRCAGLAPRYDGDDDTFSLSYYVQHPGQPPECLHFGLG